MTEPQIHHFLAEKYYSISPYVFCVGNPVNFVDPDGMDIYRYDDKTGDFILYEQNDDEYDQVAKFKYNNETGEYELKTNKKGKARIRIDKIEKGILSDGVNFMEDSQVWTTDNVSIDGFQAFIIDFADMVGKEMGGLYYTEAGSSEIKYIHMGRGKNNRYNLSTFVPALEQIRPEMKGIVRPHTNWHTHPSYSDSRMNPSRQDRESKVRQSGNGVQRFIILTGGYPPIEY